MAYLLSSPYYYSTYHQKEEEEQQTTQTMVGGASSRAFGCGGYCDGGQCIRASRRYTSPVTQSSERLGGLGEKLPQQNGTQEPPKAVSHGECQ